MKKISKIILILLMFPLLFSFVACGNTANPLDVFTLRLKAMAKCDDCFIKFDNDQTPGYAYSIKPTGFDWDKLEKKRLYNGHYGNV